MSNCRVTPTEFDIERAQRFAIADELQKKWEAEQAALPKVVPVEPCAVPPPLTTPAKPGNYFAAAARKAGCEDEYDNAMEARYGKGW
jgi:hypothetical protein